MLDMCNVCGKPYGRKGVQKIRCDCQKQRSTINVRNYVESALENTPDADVKRVLELLHAKVR